MFAQTNVPIDVLLEHIDYHSLLNLCQTSAQYRRICENPDTWIYLLRRDFEIDAIGAEIPPDNVQILYQHIRSDAPPVSAPIKGAAKDGVDNLLYIVDKFGWRPKEPNKNI